MALKYLEKALIYEKKDKNCIQMAETLLNICSILSQLKKHNQSLNNAI